MRKKISLAVPVYYEQEVILQFLKETKAVLDTLPVDYEYVFVDDGSKDQTVAILKEQAKTNPRIKMVVLSYNHGKAFAATAAFTYATGDYILYMDPDLQDPPHEIPRFFETIEQGFDLVWGIRKEKKDKFLNRLYSKVFWGTLNKYTGLEIPKGIAVMRMFTREFAQNLLQYKETNRFVEGLFMKVGMHYTTLEIDQRERFAGVSKFNFRRKMQLAFDAIFDFSELPLKFAVRLGFLFVILGILALAGLAIAKWFFIDFQAGWPSLVSVIVVGIGLQLFFLGIVSLYIGRIYKEAKNRPLFSVKEFVNINQHENV
ncbi:glycosyltransferase family 2 protein [Flavobacterium caeni]|uniref:Dolichol-phosphate mannosyltransferase n=1 Tax=Flavobacterium caeni TaxID=490189 RepID=A0A1G5FH66_9FLAO|nr:glycosyltransferase family 2 protein [Flavobacterium caeni]SCY38553.1 dolichol-phosphate mannosyltransferase [Flavobacterium caeni]